MDTYGNRIKVAREAAGLSQSALGKLIGTTGVTIMRYEKELRQPRFEQLSELAKALQLSKSFFLQTQPFEDLDFLHTFKSMILSSICSAHLISDEELETIERSSDYEYWRCISMHIVSIIEIGKYTLNIQYKDYYIGQLKIKSVPNQTDVDFNELIYGRNDEHQIHNAAILLDFFFNLNAIGQKKAMERIHELSEIERYHI